MYGSKMKQGRKLPDSMWRAVYRKVSIVVMKFGIADYDAIMTAGSESPPKGIMYS